jgi:hypothetical protein
MIARLRDIAIAARRGSRPLAQALAAAMFAACSAHTDDASAGERYTFVMDGSEVAPGEEFYGCQDVPNPFGKDIAIVSTDSTVSFGAHHMFAFQIPSEQAMFAAGATQKTPVFRCPQGGLEFHPYFHLTQRAKDHIQYPAGIGRSLKASEAIRLQVHYLNVTGAPIQVSAQVTVRYVAPEQVDQLAAGVFVSSLSLRVPSGASTQSFAYSVPADMNFLQVTGHMHRRGRHYEAHVTSATGETRPLYASDTWDEPEIRNLNPPFAVKRGDTIDYSCQFENDSATTLVYGESADTNEMCNLFGVFYPSPNGMTLLGAL